ILLQKLPIDPRDAGSQKCYIGPKTMKDLGAHIGRWVKVKRPDIKAMCMVWPRKDLHDGFIQFDPCIFNKCDGNGSKYIAECDRMRVSDLEPVQYPVRLIHGLGVTLILERAPDGESFNINGGKDEFISDHIKVLLLQRVMSVESIIDFKSISKGAQKYTNIAFIIVKDIVFTTKDLDSPVDEESDGDSIGKVTMETNVKICGSMSRERFSQQTTKQTYLIGGLEKAATMLRELISYPFDYSESFARLGLECPKGVLLHGPPGVGKTLLVKSVCSECNAYVVSINGPEIFGSLPGESEENLRQAFQKASNLAKEGPTVLFIDELDTLCPKRGHASQGHENRIVAQLLTLMDGLESRGKLIVIGATNRPNVADTALRRPGRFDREVIIGVPNQMQREEILEAHIKAMKTSCDVDFTVLAEITKGYVGADITALCREASFSALGRLKGQLDKTPMAMEVNMTDFKSAMNKIVPSVLRGSDALVDFKPVLWSDIGSLEEVKTQLQQAIEWPLKYPGSFTRLGISRPKGVLLYGPPGCCKTTLVRAAATACNATFLAVSGAQLYSPYVGDSEKSIAEVFHHARLGAPSILFLDEVDSIIGKRSMDGKQGHSVQERVLATLLNEMDGIGISLDEKKEPEQQKILEDRQLDGAKKVHESAYTVSNNDILLVAATNRPDLVDSALLRPGRIDRIIYVPPPDNQARESILKIHTSKMPIAEDVDLSDIAKKTHLYSGADLENLCREAAITALQENGLDTTHVGQANFLTALAVGKPSLTEAQITHYTKLSTKL
ncbi:ATPase family gene 2 protein homolog B-like, partial [Glandiceps talaboti]